MKKICLEIMQIHFGLQKQSIEVGQTKMRKTMSSCTTIQSVEYGMPPRMVCRHQRQNTLQAVEHVTFMFEGAKPQKNY